MCAPVAMAIASFAIGAAQTVVGFMGEQAAADAQNQYYAENAKAARQATVNQYAHQQNRIIQERRAASQEKQNATVDALKARATAKTAAGEAGVSGLSVDALVQDFYAQEGRYSNSIDNNFQMTSDYLRSEMESTQAQGQSRINSVRRATPPSFLGAAIRIGATALDAFGTYHRSKTA